MQRLFFGLEDCVRGKTVVVTGASDGIGAHLAPRLAAAGARVLLVARTAEKLRVVGDRIRAAGGEAHEYVGNLSDDEDCQRVVREILAEQRYVDIFVSNAGRSIRRSAEHQGSDRFHDFQRLMALNFFGSLRLILGLLPSMIERGSGHIVHVSSFGVPTRQPRFSGYCASKSALDAALQSMAGEVASRGISTSSVYMPLVQTKMVQSKGHSYDHVSLLTVDMACDLIEHAIITKDAEVTDAPSRFLALLYFFRPSLIVALNSLVYSLEGERPPDSMIAKKSDAGSKRKAKKGATPHGGFSPLKALGSLLGFFAWLEMFFTRIGVAWVLRDPIIVLVLLLVLVLQPICAGALAMWRFSRRSLQWCVQVCGKYAALGQSGDVLAPAPPGELLYRSVSLDVVARPESGVRGARRAKTMLCSAACGKPESRRSLLQHS